MLRILILSFAILAGTMAKAEPFVKGERIKMTGTILCDTFEQMDEILTAQERSFAEAVDVYRKWYATKNDLNQASCMYVQPPRWFEAELVGVVKTYVVYNSLGEQNPIHAIGVVWFDRNENQYTGFIFSDREVVGPKPEGSSL